MKPLFSISASGKARSSSSSAGSFAVPILRSSRPIPPSRSRAPATRPWRCGHGAVFWIMYLMFVMMAAGGLMAIAQLGPIAADFKIAGHAGYDCRCDTCGLAVCAHSRPRIQRLLAPVLRLDVGSHRPGEHNVHCLCHQGAGIICLGEYGRDPVLFVILSGLVFFAWGEIYSLFPALCGDIFGSRYVSTNAGILYTAKGTAALLVPYTSALAAAYGWAGVFYAAASLNIATAFLAIAVLKPLRKRYVTRNR